MRVVEVVAAEKGVDPTDLPPLHDVVDADALDALFDPGRIDAGRAGRGYELRFPYAGLEVRVRDGDVSAGRPRFRHR